MVFAVTTDKDIVNLAAASALSLFAKPQTEACINIIGDKRLPEMTTFYRKADVLKSI